MKKVLFPTLLALLLVTIVSCDKEDKKLTPATPAYVHLAKEYTITGNDTILTTYYWDNNVLKKAVTEEGVDWDSTSNLITTTTFYYENGLLTESHVKLTFEGVSVSKTNTLSYENGHISQFVSSYSIYDTIMVIDNFEFDAIGNITKMVYHREYGDIETLLTWDNGDAVTVSEGGVTYDYAYDGNPNAYTGFPIWMIENVVEHSMLASKHNRIDTVNFEYTYVGDKLVSKKQRYCNDGCLETHYVYTDGTGR